MKFLFKKGNPITSNYDDINEEDIFTDEGNTNNDLPFDFNEELNKENDIINNIDIDNLMGLVKLDEDIYDEKYDEVDEEDLYKLKQLNNDYSFTDNNNYNKLSYEQKNEIDIELDNILNTIYDSQSALKVNNTITIPYIVYLYDILGYNRLISFLKDLSNKLEFYNVYLNETIIGFINSKFSINDLRR